MEKRTQSGQIMYRVVTVVLLLIIIIYQVKLDAKLTKSQATARQAASSAAAAEESIEKVKSDLNEITERLGI